MATITHERSGCTMQSRTGEDYSASCGHILDELHEAAAQYDPGAREICVVLGEVWHPMYAFPKISGMFRKRAPSNLQFMANDLLPPDLVSDQPYSLRLTDVQALLPVIYGADPYCLPVEGIGYTDDASPLQHATRLKNTGGYDGAILRDPTAPYTIGLAREGQIVKVKPSLSLDLRCNGVIQGEGKHYGKLGAITVSYRGVNSAVGTGFSDEDRERMWQGACCAFGEAAEHNPINRIVEVECMGITVDGRLREPRFKGIRFDKTESD
jgi:DNA ligase-1